LCRRVTDTDCESSWGAVTIAAEAMRAAARVILDAVARWAAAAKSVADVGVVVLMAGSLRGKRGTVVMSADRPFALAWNRKDIVAR
jgi:hypothetical protein